MNNPTGDHRKLLKIEIYEKMRKAGLIMKSYFLIISGLVVLAWLDSLWSGNSHSRDYDRNTLSDHRGCSI